MGLIFLNDFNSRVAATALSKFLGRHQKIPVGQQSGPGSSFLWLPLASRNGLNRLASEGPRRSRPSSLSSPSCGSEILRHTTHAFFRVQTASSVLPGTLLGSLRETLECCLSTTSQSDFQPLKLCTVIPHIHGCHILEVVDPVTVVQ